MGMTRFNLIVFIICDAYNQLNIENKLDFIVNNYISEISERLKRIQEEKETLEMVYQSIFRESK